MLSVAMTIINRSSRSCGIFHNAACKSASKAAACPRQTAPQAPAQRLIKRVKGLFLRRLLKNTVRNAQRKKILRRQRAAPAAASRTRFASFQMMLAALPGKSRNKPRFQASIPDRHAQRQRAAGTAFADQDRHNRGFQRHHGPLNFAQLRCPGRAFPRRRRNMRRRYPQYRPPAGQTFRPAASGAAPCVPFRIGRAKIAGDLIGRIHALFNPDDRTRVAAKARPPRRQSPGRRQRAGRRAVQKNPQKFRI